MLVTTATRDYTDSSHDTVHAIMSYPALKHAVLVMYGGYGEHLSL